MELKIHWWRKADAALDLRVRVLLRGLNANHKQVFSKGKRKVLRVPGGRKEEMNAETLEVNEQNRMPSWVMGERSCRG